jgi:hypothetical protein
MLVVKSKFTAVPGEGNDDALTMSSLNCFKKEVEGVTHVSTLHYTGSHEY